MRLVAANIPIRLFKLDEGLSVRAALGAQGMTLFSPIERAVRIRTGKTDKVAVQTLTDISCDEEGDNGA